MSLEELLPSIRSCTLCRDLPLGPKPIFQLHAAARILIVGQAPGRIAHQRGRPFDDPSGNNLRKWMGVNRETFYDATQIALLPMGLCYPGTRKGGDLPPRPICAATWRHRVLPLLSNVKLTLVLGQCAHDWHLPAARGMSLTDRVRAWDGAPVVPLPHPSPRNGVWQKNNPWFAAEILPRLRHMVQQALL